MPYFGFLTKNTLFGLLFGKNCQKIVAIFEISTLKFACLQNFTKTQKCLNLGTKRPDLGSFGVELEDNLIIFEINTLEFA